MSENTEQEITAQGFLEQQRNLEEEARRLMPWNPTKCTYELGPTRQQIFACRDHGNIALCYSCSIICHTSCDIVELFTKRDYTCDCGTERDTKRAEKGDEGEHLKYFCQLRKNTERNIPSTQNIYGQNFKGLFCSCSEEYDPESEAVMLQCVAGLECNEDWYHDYCLLGSSKDPGERVVSKATEENIDLVDEKILPGFPELDTFDALICPKCTAKYNYYFERLISHSSSDTFISSVLKVGEKDIKKEEKAALKKEEDKKPQEEEKAELKNETREDLNDKPIEKKRRIEQIVGPYSILLKKNYSEKLKELLENLKETQSDPLISFIENTIPHLIKDEPIFEPKDDAAPTSSIHDLALGLLNGSVDRENTVGAIVAFHGLKDELGNFFQSFAQDGKVVKGEDIKDFFDEKKDA